MNHQAWQNILAEQAKDDAPELIVLGGGSATGKSTAISLLGEVGAIKEGSLIIDDELIRALIPELYDGHLTRHPEKTPENKPKYIAARNQMVLDCLRQGISIVLDDHCDDMESIKKLMVDVKKSHAKVQTGLLGLFIEPQAYAERLRKVGISGAANPDYQFAMTSARDFCNNFNELIPLFDTSLLIENSDSKPHIVAKYIVDDGNTKEITKDDQRYKKFTDIRCYQAPLPERKAPEPQIVGNGLGSAGENHHPERVRGLSFSERIDPNTYKVDWRELAKTIRTREKGIT